MGEGIEMGHSDDEDTSSDEDDKKAAQVKPIHWRLLKYTGALVSEQILSELLGYPPVRIPRPTSLASVSEQGSRYANRGQ